MNIYQLSENCFRGDAIGNHVAMVDQLLSAHGFGSNIFALGHSTDIKVLSPEKVAKICKADDLLIYHHSSGNDHIHEAYCNANCHKAIWYHNVTPAEFFHGYGWEYEDSCAKARDRLKQYADITEFSFSASSYSAKELEEFGFKNIDVVPILIELSSASSKTDISTRPSGDKKRNILFVGRLAPNKRHQDLLRIFAYYQSMINPNSRLWIVGDHTISSYVEEIRSLIYGLNIEEHVFMTGKVSDKELEHLYKQADVYLCMSQHEGFCVPLLEAMGYKVPIVALDRGAISDTLGDSGIMVRQVDLPIIAEIMEQIFIDDSFRESILSGQQKRLDYFSYDKTADKILALVKQRCQFM